MLTKKQVFDAALKYAQEQNPGVRKAAIIADGDFIAGAKWAAEQMQEEKERLAAAIEGAVTDLLAGASRNAVRERLEKALEK